MNIKAGPVLLPYYFFGKLDRAARDGNDFIVGTGIPADSAAIVKSPVFKVEAAIDVHIRQGPQVEQWYEGNVAHFRVPSGPQDDANGSPSDRDDRAAWNWTYSFFANQGLDRFNFTIKVDRDPSENTNFQTFKGFQSPDKIGLDWYSLDTDQFVWSDDEGDKYVTQNSRNFAFDELRINHFDYHDLHMGRLWELVYEHKMASDNPLDHKFVDFITRQVEYLNKGLPDAYDFGPGEFDIILDVDTRLGIPVMENHVVVEVI